MVEGLSTEVTSRKRQRAHEPHIHKKQESRIYTPFRAIGHVSNHVPFDIHIRGTQFLLTTCIGKAIQTYDCARLNLLFISPQFEYPITAIVSQSDLILVANGPLLTAVKRGKEQWRIRSSGNSHITHLVTFGSYICATTENQTLLVYDATSLELHTQMALRKETEVSCLLHPDTELNKVILGSTDGHLQVWNIRTGSLKWSTCFEGSITAVAAAPVLDIVTIGFLDGRIIIYHYKADERLIELRQEGRVTAISFRTDGVQVMATSNNSGDISFWDLEESRIAHVSRGAHSGSIASIKFLNGQPILLSSGTDNAVREWIFDSVDGLPRLLRSRSGHHAPPTSISFYGETSQFLLSASRDRSLRGFSLYRDAQTAELSQGAIQSTANKTNARIEDLKLPEILAIAHQSSREKDWDNVLTAHKDDSAARSWRWINRRLGSHELRTKDKAAVRSVAISACGNFGLVGSKNGLIDLYNLQSGLHRRTYQQTQKHSKEVTGISSDTLNKTMISSSLDGTVRFWDFNTGNLLHTSDLKVGITSMRYHRGSDLIALSCDDFCIRVLDAETKKIVRELWGHINRITTMDFSDDGRWLVSAALDSTIRTWDLPTGHTIDAIRTQAVCTSLSFSPTGEYLATTHIDSIGIHLWTNKAQFSPVSSRHVTEEEIQEIIMPTASGEGGTGIIEMALEDEPDEKPLIGIDHFDTVDQLSENLLTMSMVPKSKWQNLLNLDIIRQRNKPKEAPKAPEKLPFDLGTLRDLKNGAGLLAPLNNEDDGSTSRVLNLHQPNSSQFTTLLNEYSETQDCAEFIEHLKTLGPAELDIEIHSLSPTNDFFEHRTFLQAMTQRLQARRDYELCQVYVASFLKAHGDLLAENINEQEDLGLALVRWQQVQESERQRLADLVGYCNGVVRFFAVK